MVMLKRQYTTGVGWQTVEDTGGGGAGLSVLGPVEINWDDPPDESSGTGMLFYLADLDPDTVIIKAWAFTRENWALPGGALVTLNMGVGYTPDATNNFWALADYNANTAADYSGADQGTEQPPGDASLVALSGWTERTGKLVASLGSFDPSNLSAGRSVCGALVWTP